MNKVLVTTNTFSNVNKMSKKLKLLTLINQCNMIKLDNYRKD